MARDTLITDYIGPRRHAAFVNAGLLTLVVAAIYRFSGDERAVACLLLVLGFALFGRIRQHLADRSRRLALCALQARKIRTAHQHRILRLRAGAGRFEILFSSALQVAVAIPLALAPVAMGFVLPPAAAQLFRAHDGFSLYNMGFTAGIVGTLTVAIYKSYGFVPEPVFIWSTGPIACSALSSGSCLSR